MRQRNRDVAQSWAHQNLTDQSPGNGQSHSGNLYYTGSKIYSYGPHYLLGNLYPEKDVALVNSKYASVTTSQHKGDVAIALSCTPYRQITVPIPHPDTPDDHAINLEHLNNEREKYQGKAIRARLEVRKRSHWCMVEKLEKDYDRYKAAFELSRGAQQ